MKSLDKMNIYSTKRKGGCFFLNRYNIFIIKACPHVSFSISHFQRRNIHRIDPAKNKHPVQGRDV